MPHSKDGLIEDALVAADGGGLSERPLTQGGVSLQQATDILLRAVKEAQCCEGILRSHVVKLETDLEVARQEACDHSRMAKEATIENQQLKEKLETLGKLVSKQQQVIKDHEGRLRAFGARTVGAMLARKTAGIKRPSVGPEESPKEEAKQVKDVKEVEDVEAKPAKRSKGILEDKTNLMEKAKVISPPRKRVDKAKRPQKGKHEKPNSPRSEGEESHSSDSTYKASKETGSEDESQNEEPESEALQVSGLRIWEKKFPKEPRSALVPLPPAFTSDRVRAEGTALPNATSSGFSVPCRCVVRGKARGALQGFDCEQCRNFYAATKIEPKVGDLKASRHRMDHAPTCTPPGFWDLSFPQDG